MLKDELRDNRFDSLISETIKHLVDGYINEAGEGFVEIANYFAKAGLLQESFENMRKYIIKSAMQRTGDTGFILAKLQEIDKSLREKRDLHNIVKH